jgi:GT2 family glycosyltransferase
MSKTDLSANVGIVVIGRNEGKRLEQCLQSLVAQSDSLIVYVDSGSSDGSVQFARNLGVVVEELDTSIPFTMARGRNTGFARLMSLRPGLRYGQFVDGDCEVEPAWVSQAADFLHNRPEVSAVCGFRRERFRDASIYNHLIDLEWQGPVGEISSCGGDAMYRVETFQQSGGFNETLIAGEEPELCVRLRQVGGLIWRIDQPMTLHDANITRFSQWWTRAKRAGYAYAEGVVLHGSSPQRHYVKALARTLIHGLIIPCVFLAGIVLGLLVPKLFPLVPLSVLIAVLLYAKSFIGAFRARRRQKNSFSESLLYAAFNLIAKLPEAQGALKYFVGRALGRKSAIIEYKQPSP